MTGAGPASAPEFLAGELSEAERGPGAAFHVLPVPLERTVSFGAGTARGPEAILAASRELERICPGDLGASGGWEEPCRLGVHTLAPLPCEGPIAGVMDALRARTRAIAGAGRVPVVLGGEHSLTYGAAMGVADALGRPLGMVQVDAHADLRVAYGGEPHSHASVMDLLVREGLPLAQVGVRALCREELAARERHGVLAWDAHGLARGRAGEVRLPEGFPRDLYVTFDVDGLDPSLMPATGTPVPGGLGFEEALGLVERLMEGRRIAGLDVVELAPSPAHPHCDFAAAQLAYRLMALAARGLSSPARSDTPFSDGLAPDRAERALSGSCHLN